MVLRKCTLLYLIKCRNSMLNTLDSKSITLLSIRYTILKNLLTTQAGIKKADIEYRYYKETSSHNQPSVYNIQTNLHYKTPSNILFFTDNSRS